MDRRQTRRNPVLGSSARVDPSGFPNKALTSIGIANDMTEASSDSNASTSSRKRGRDIRSSCGEYESTNDVLTVQSPSWKSLKRRRSSLGDALRVKTPLKCDQEHDELSENSENNSCNYKKYEVNRSNIVFNCLKNANERVEDAISSSIGLNRSTTKANTDTKRSIPTHIGHNDALHPRLKIDHHHHQRMVDSEQLAAADDSWNINFFYVGKPLGKGKFGNVYLCTRKVPPHTKYAMKVVFKQKVQAKQSDKQQLLNEVWALQSLKHKNITKIYGFFENGSVSYNILLKYADRGELYKHVRQLGGRVSEEVCIQYINDIASGVAHMHGRGFFHRDLKPENILMMSDGRLCIADFGAVAITRPHPHPQHDISATSSVSLPTSGTGTDISSEDNICCYGHIKSNRGSGITAPSLEAQLHYTNCGTPEYMSPEMLANRGHTAAVDLWAIGVMIFELLYGRTPFVEYEQTQNIKYNKSKINIGTTTNNTRNSIDHQVMFRRILQYNGDLDFPRPMSDNDMSSIISSHGTDSHSNSSHSGRTTSPLRSIEESMGEYEDFNGSSSSSSSSSRRSSGGHYVA